jgi:non-specific serine/threonine protein kinase
MVQSEEQFGTTRFRLLETIRQYAIEQLEQSGEAAAVWRAHRDWYLALAERAESEMSGPQHAAWLDRLEAEHDNLRAALDWSRLAYDFGGEESAAELEAGLRIANALAPHFWTVRGHHREGRARLASLLALDGRPTLVRTAALGHAAYLALRQGDYAAAPARLEESLARSRELDDKPGTARALVILGETLYASGELARARLLSEEGLQVAREVADWKLIESALGHLADIAYSLGDHGQAEQLYEAKLVLCQEKKYQHGIAYALRGLGNLARTRGDCARATDRLHKSLQLLVQLKDRRCTPLTLEGLACLASEHGRAECAARLFGAAEALREAIGVTLLPAEQLDHDRAVGRARRALGGTRCAMVWAESRGLAFDEAVAYALSAAGEVSSVRAGRQAVDEEASTLTAREREVVALIARGHTNAQIAEELVVSIRTVEQHIRNVYEKIGVEGKAGRASVAAFALRHGLDSPERKCTSKSSPG